MKTQNYVIVPLNFKSLNDINAQNELGGKPVCDCITTIGPLFDNIKTTNIIATDINIQCSTSYSITECDPNRGIFPFDSDTHL